MPSFRPLNDTIVVAFELPPEKRGMFFRLEDQSILQGTVVAVGLGKAVKKKSPDGPERSPLGVAVGDRVAFHRWHKDLKSGSKIADVLTDLYDNKPVAVLKPEDIIGVLEGDAPMVIDTDVRTRPLCTSLSTWVRGSSS